MKLRILVGLLTACLFCGVQATAQQPCFSIWDVSWAIWHEGAIVWNGDDYLPDSQVFRIIVDHQNGRTKECMQRAGEKGVVYLVPQAIDLCWQRHPLASHMNWVCNHERAHGGMDSIDRAATARDIPGVRNAFHDYEKDDPNVQNITACYNTSQILSIVKSECALDSWVYTPPKPVVPHAPGH